MFQKRKENLNESAVIYPLNLRGIGGQTCGQSSRAVPVIVKPADLLAQHGLKTKPPQPARQQLPGHGEGIALYMCKHRGSIFMDA